MSFSPFVKEMIEQNDYEDEEDGSDE